MEIRNLKVLVTGGAGFIGSHIVEDLVHRGAQVTVLDNLTTGTLENLAAVQGNCRFVQGDIRDVALLQQLMHGMELVSHQAAQLEIFRASEDPSYDLAVNTVGTLNVLHAAEQAGVAKVVNASSACVYGQKDGLTPEEAPCHPNWTYGVSKLAAEEYARIYAEYRGLPVVSLRYAIVFGEREWFRRVLPIFLKRALQGRPPVVFGSGDAVRDFIHVADVVDLHRRCVEQPQAAGQVFNVGRGVGTSVMDLAHTVTELFLPGQAPSFEALEQGKVSALVPGKRRNTAELHSMLLDPAKARAVLGWAPQVSLETGLRRELEWARHHLHRWETILNTQGG